MNSLIIVVFIFWIVFLLLFVMLFYAVIRGIGLKNVIVFMKVREKRRKGWGMVRLIYKTGVERYVPCKFEGEMLEPEGTGKGRYIYKAHCVSLGAFNVPTISYRQGDADPIHPMTGLQTVTSTKMLENIVARAIKAENSQNQEWKELFKKYGIPIGIFILAIIGGLLFIILNQNQTLTDMAAAAGKTVVVNATSLGR